MNARHAYSDDQQEPVVQGIREGSGIYDIRPSIVSYQRTLYARAYRLCGNREDAWDLVQDTYERALRHGAVGWPKPNVLGWLLTVLRNRWVDGRRRAHAERLVDLDCADQVAVSVEASPPLAAMISDDNLGRALCELKSPFRSVIELHFFGGRSYDEIAAHLAIPKATVGTRLARARKRLAALLAPALSHAIESNLARGGSGCVIPLGLGGMS
jgi:RNA polymerase sigma-70 factor (ECF subfamily)